MKSLFIILGTVVLSGCSDTGEQIGDYSSGELKHALRIRESDDPLAYLDHEAVKLIAPDAPLNLAGNYSEELPDQYGSRVEGIISNDATLARFQHVRVSVKFLSRLRAPLGQNEFVITDVVEPGGEVPFSIAVHPPAETRSIEFSIVEAKPLLE